MYNLFVTAQAGAWDQPVYEIDRGRFLEYTSDEIASRFKDLTPRQKSSLIKLPCLFAYEGTSSPMRIGKLRSIELRGRTIRIKYAINADIPPIAYESIRPLQLSLDIRDWELSRTHWAVKSEDLFQLLREAMLLPITVPTPLVRRDPLPPREEDGRVVSSVSDFFQAVLGLGNQEKEIFYRGHSNKVKYRLEPSVFRRDDQGNYIYLDVEDRLYRELLVSNSGDFQGDVYTLDRLVRMQHYSLPTRLLDITSNPLIALYFACCGNQGTFENGSYVNEIPGEVISFAIDKSRIKYFDSDTASCMANLARLPKADKEAIDYGLEGDLFNEQLAIQRLLHFVREEKSFFEPRIKRDDLRSVICIKSKKTNDRITSQSGAFLLFGQDAVLDEVGSPEFQITRIEVVRKAEILKQLDLLNINERTVFPYIENSARYIAQKYSFRG